MCRACKVYGKRLVLTPITDEEHRVWNGMHRFLGPVMGLRAFRFWHRWMVK